MSEWIKRLPHEQRWALLTRLRVFCEYKEEESYSNWFQKLENLYSFDMCRIVSITSFVIFITILVLSVEWFGISAKECALREYSSVFIWLFNRA